MKEALNKLQEVAAEVIGANLPADPKLAKANRLILEDVIRQLTGVATQLDSVVRPASFFDPTDPETAGRILALTLVAQPRHPLPPPTAFYGSGIYALYYKGDFEPYQPISQSEHPIYVGKADPGKQNAKDSVSQGIKIAPRLAEHAKSIRSATSTLRLSDFDCRYLVVQSGFQKPAEDFLIHFFKPIWNSETKICFGLGKHGDSSETRGNKRSPWDTIHPGRKWASSSTLDQKPEAQIRQEIANHFDLFKPYQNVAEVFERFMQEMRQSDAS